MRAPRWTPDEIARLEELLSRGLSDAEIGKRLGRSDNAVNLARKRHSIPSRTACLLTSRTVARRLGLGCSKKVAHWIKRGWLRGRRAAGAGKHRMWVIEEDDLLKFLEDPRYWHIWQPERLADPVEREWAMEVRTERYLTTGEVGKRFGVVSNAVHAWIQRGLLPAVRWGNWMVRESDLSGFVPPYERSRLGGSVRRFTAAEDMRLQVLRVEGGCSWTEIAQELGRPISSVYGRYRRRTRATSAPSLCSTSSRRQWYDDNGDGAMTMLDEKTMRMLHRETQERLAALDEEREALLALERGYVGMLALLPPAPSTPHEEDPA